MESKKSTILIVDDEAELREILTFTFERKGYKVLTASNAVEGIEITKKNKIDVIISDIRMPGGNGIQLLEDVKKSNPKIPMVLFITGFTDMSLEEAYDKGVEAVFSKPFNTKILIATVERMLESLEKKWKVNREQSSFQIEIRQKSYDQARQANVLNIGRGGFFVSLSENFPKIDELVNFKMIFNGEQLTLIEGSGKIKWVRSNQIGELPPGCGVEFISLDEFSKIKLLKLINFLKTEQYIPIS